MSRNNKKSSKRLSNVVKYYKCPRCGFVNYEIEDLLYMLQKRNEELSRLEGEIRGLEGVNDFLRKSYISLSKRNVFDRLLNRGVIEI